MSKGIYFWYNMLDMVLQYAKLTKNQENILTIKTISGHDVVVL